MNLVIDIGNTLAKISIFDKHKLLYNKSFNTFSTLHLQEFLLKKKMINLIDGAIICTVAQKPQDLRLYLKDKCFTLLFNHNTPIPIKNKYFTPKTLGKDRLAAAIGAFSLFPEQNVLCIDMGTCIKYDFVDCMNNYMGGGISPGLDMRFKALNTFTKKLPLIKYNDIDFLTGNTTKTSILSGVINGITKEINGTIEEYAKSYSNLKVIVTGGDAKYFEKKIFFNIFATPNIVTLGLNFVLNFNKSSF